MLDREVCDDDKSRFDDDEGPVGKGERYA